MRKQTPIDFSILLMGLGLILFVWAKWSDLSLPFFWDELGVYAPGVLHLLDHGVGILPADMPPELSRGHPLFFYFFFALYTKLVGYSIFKLHVFALVLTVAWVLSTWWMGRRVLGRWAGTLAGLTLLAMPNVFAQAHLVLPEVLLALLVIWALYHFYQHYYWAYVIWASLAVLTKESALVLPLACLTYSLLFQPGQRWRLSLISLSPILVFLLFLVVQRIQNGWFFFPFHTQFISFSGAELSYKLGLLADLLFAYQGRWLLSIGLGLGLLLFIYRKRSIRVREIHPWFKLSGIYLLGLIAFTLINVYMDRYLLSLLPLLALGLGAVWWETQFQTKAIVYAGLLLWLIPMGFLPFHRGDTFRYDMDISYRDILEVQQAAATYLEKNIPPGDTIFASFPLYNTLLDPRFGFIEDSVDFYPSVRPQDPNSHVSFVQPGVKWPGPLLDSTQLIWTYSRGYAWSEVYSLTAN